MPTTKYEFNTPGNYEFNGIKLDGAGKGILDFEDKLEQSIENFLNDTGFVYDPSKVEFTIGGDLGIYSDFNTKDANLALGSLVGTLDGTASILNDALILLLTDGYVDYDGSVNAPQGNEGAMRIKWRSNYSVPTANKMFISIGRALASNDNELRVYHSAATKKLSWLLYSNTGAVIATGSSASNFVPTIGGQYEAEINFDTTIGEYRLFLNGVLVSEVLTGTGLRGDTNIIRIGESISGVASEGVDVDVLDFQIFHKVQHTANYVPALFSPTTIVRQIDQTPVNASFGVSFLSLNKQWDKEGESLISFINGAPIITGGKLQCFGAHGACYDYLTTPLETHKIKYTPNYTGGPAQNVNIMSAWNMADNKDRFNITHSPSGQTLRLFLYDNNGVVIHSASALGLAFNAVAGQEYELEVGIDAANGEFYLFIDGNLHANLSSGNWTRGGESLDGCVGASTSIYNVANASFDDYIVFKDLQHTAGYDPGYAIVDNIYLSSDVELPTVNYIGLGVVQNVGPIIKTGDNVPGHSSDNTDNTVLIVLNFQDTNDIESIEKMDINYTGQKYKSEGTILTNTPMITDLIETSVIQSDADPGDYVGFAMKIGQTTLMYYTPTNKKWNESDGSEAQTNTAEEIALGIASLVEDHSEVQLFVLMKSGDGTSTPFVESALFVHDLGALKPGEPLRCIVGMFLADVEGSPIEGVSVKVSLNRNETQYKEASDYVIGRSVSKVTDDQGFVGFNLIRSSQYETEGDPMKYKIEFSIDEDNPMNNNGLDADSIPLPILYEVPDLAEVNITDKIIAL